MKDLADFATVSGQCKNLSRPERLCRKCGFAGNDVWHILRKIQKNYEGIHEITQNVVKSLYTQNS